MGTCARDVTGLPRPGTIKGLGSPLYSYMISIGEAVRGTKREHPRMGHYPPAYALYIQPPHFLYF